MPVGGTKTNVRAVVSRVAVYIVIAVFFLAARWLMAPQQRMAPPAAAGLPILAVAGPNQWRIDKLVMACAA